MHNHHLLLCHYFSHIPAFKLHTDTWHFYFLRSNIYGIIERIFAFYSTKRILLKLLTHCLHSWLRYCHHWCSRCYTCKSLRCFFTFRLTRMVLLGIVLHILCLKYLLSSIWWCACRWWLHELLDAWHWRWL